MITDEPTELVAALKRHDQSAWSSAVDLHLHELYGFIYHLIGRRQAIAEDLNQETWLEAVDGIERYDERKGTLRNWLFGIARKRVAMYFRRRSAVGHPRFFSDLSEQNPELDNRSVLPEDVLEQVEESAMVRAALLLLSRDGREVVLAKYVEGLSVKAIAARSGKTVKAVESLLSRTREQLRLLLSGYVKPCSDGRLGKQE